MNISVFRAISFAFALLLFMAALGYMIFQTTNIIPSFDLVKNPQETVYQQEVEIPKEVYWTGEQVVGKLYRLTEEDMVIYVNGLAFHTDRDVINKQSAVILNAKYSQSIKLNANGEIESMYFDMQ